MAASWNRAAFCLLVCVVIALMTGLLPLGTAPTASAMPGAVRQREVCFTVHVPGDPRAHQVSGTVFHSSHRFTGGNTALLLQHGAVSERSVWDVSGWDFGVAPSPARQLAAAGYDVFAIDRLGYGRSTYPGSGWALTQDGYVAMAHEIVTQLREGTYRLSDSTCEGGTPPPRPAPKVVLVGWSGGGQITQLYATRHHDIDAAVPSVYTANGASLEFIDYLLATLAPQWATGNDYVHMLSVDPDGYSRACERWVFYVAGASEEMVQRICGQYVAPEPRLMPSGDLASSFATGTRIQQDIQNVGPTPVLLVLADRDAIFPDYRAELELWRHGCNCDVELLLQRDAGHAAYWQRSGPEAVAGILDWLGRHGL